MLSSRSGHEVDVPAVAGPDDAPGAERAGEPERGAAGRARDRPRRVARVALERDVEVVGGRPSRRSRTAPPTSHASCPASDLARDGQRVAHAPTSRGTRAEIPQVTS